MPLSLLTDPNAVRAAMDEFDQLGREAFLSKYGFGAAKRFYVLRDGKRYDSKAIAGVAVGKQHPDQGPLKSKDFAGGELSVRKRLAAMGFEFDTNTSGPLRLDQESMEALRRRFLQMLPVFQTFAESGSEFRDKERAYKDDACRLFRELVLPLAQRMEDKPAAKVQDIIRAYHAVLTRKLASGYSQNIINWQVHDRLKPGGPLDTPGAGKALLELLTGADDHLERMTDFIEEVGGILKKAGVSGPYGAARLLGSTALMFLDPTRHIAVRTDLFTRAVPRLLGVPFPPASDEPERYRIACELASLVREHLDKRWHWAPRDLIDVQSFLWVALMWSTDDAERPDLTEQDETSDDPWAGLFLPQERLEEILSLWRIKKNLILQGAPGVGKTFVAKHLAYALMGERDPARFSKIQFHQSYAYEDFVRGWKPTDTGGFVLRDGVFHRFCERARADAEHDYVFGIDEINRGNLSKIFGELLLLLEADKRGPDWAVELAYSDPDEPYFFVPKNVYVIGMMNTADRSLSLVDYALRRRFAFETLAPCFSSPAFRQHLSDAGVPDRTIERVIVGMTALNTEIEADRANLGPGFRIGHSFFTPSESNPYGPGWFDRIVRSEIRPLLEEYWFDDPAKAEAWTARLLGAQ